MKSLTTALLAMASPALLLAAVTDMRVQHLDTPLATATLRPEFSWRLDTRTPGAVQDTYRILVASSPELIARGEGDLWDSGTVRSRSQHGIVYSGKPLKEG